MDAGVERTETDREPITEQKSFTVRSIDFFTDIYGLMTTHWKIIILWIVLLSMIWSPFLFVFSLDKAPPSVGNLHTYSFHVLSNATTPVDYDNVIVETINATNITTVRLPYKFMKPTNRRGSDIIHNFNSPYYETCTAEEMEQCTFIFDYESNICQDTPLLEYVNDIVGLDKVINELMVLFVVIFGLVVICILLHDMDLLGLSKSCFDCTMNKRWLMQLVNFAFFALMWIGFVLWYYTTELYYAGVISEIAQTVDCPCYCHHLVPNSLYLFGSIILIVLLWGTSRIATKVKNLLHFDYLLIGSNSNPIPFVIAQGLNPKKPYMLIETWSNIKKVLDKLPKNADISQKIDNQFEAKFALEVLTFFYSIFNAAILMLAWIGGWTVVFYNVRDYADPTKVRYWIVGVPVIVQIFSLLVNQQLRIYNPQILINDQEFEQATHFMTCNWCSCKKKEIRSSNDEEQGEMELTANIKRNPEENVENFSV